MTINKFQGKTEEEALEKAKSEMGQGLVIMNVRVVKPKGLFGFLKTPYYEVTAAMEDKEQTVMATPASGTHRSINLAADEQIDLPKPEAIQPEAVRKVVPPVEPISEAARAVGDILSAHEARKQPESAKTVAISDTDMIEERLENLQQFLEKKLTDDASSNGTPNGTDAVSPKDEANEESVRIFRMLYRTLLDNEVDEVYINQLLDDVMKVARKGSSMDFILSHVYQKMILKFGNPHVITVKGKDPQIAFFIGPTGVGKTTTIAKIASKFKVEQGKKVAFLTADTYRISATEQLRTYANILDAPLTVIYAPEELPAAVDKLSDYDLIFVDTAGFSHKNEMQREDTKKLFQMLGTQYQTIVYLVLSSTTKYRDLKEICDMYRSISDYSLIFTKLDETSAYGNLLNIKLYADADISYTTNGQNVPDDIAVFQSQEIVKKLLGGE
ncbi:MAG: flagellar biosynthesis protein FlhF [Lachnospiraceae bacterium]|nr:flagellar biosynthesis protein FlhF [Lachnospiraceae bacterium]